MTHHSTSSGLRKKLDNLVKKTDRPVAIFDLDGTVFDVIYRCMEILNRFLAQPEIQKRFPEQAAAASTLKYENYLYSLEATLNSAGIDRYSEHSARFLHAAETFWFKHFFTDDILAFDRPYSGAATCAKHLHKEGVHLVYLSGRDIPNMSKGTIEALERAGLPHTGHRVTICLKPAYGQDDLLFKRQSLETINQLGQVILTIDNEPANVRLFIENFPEALNIHFDTLYARALELKGPSLAVIKNFQEMGFV